jgi:hypothetical protein
MAFGSFGRWTPLLGAAASTALIALAAPSALAQSSPLSRSFSNSTSPLGGATTQPPALRYYGQSYSLYYDKPPAGGVDPGPAYAPSLRYDPYYGPHYLERFERGQRFGPLAPRHGHFNDR